MQYVSPFKAFRQNISSGVPKLRHQVTSEVLEWEIRPITAEFGKLGDEQEVFNPISGTTELVAEITTGVYDTEVAQATYGWSALEREEVERVLDRVAETQPWFVHKLVPVHVEAPIPWQSYAETPEEKVVALAETLGLVPEALRYEREQEARPKLLAALEKAMAPAEAARSEPIEKVEIPTEAPALRIGRAPQITRTGIVKETPNLELRPEASEVVEEPAGGGPRVRA